MLTPKIEQLIIKFITNQASISEIEFITRWLKEDKSNQLIFKDYVKINFAVDCVLQHTSSDEALAKVTALIKLDRRTSIIRFVKTYAKYAALFVFCFLGYYFYQKNTAITPEKNVLTPKEEFVTLQMADGTVHQLNTNSKANFRNKYGEIIGIQNKAKLMYDQESTHKNLQYNTITIPYGKVFEVQLSDGTLVYLNSGTTLKYPTKFIEGQSRHVFLTGEAYFEVAKNKKMPFLVTANKMEVKVLGTHFNIAAYQDEDAITATLLEGKVAVEVDNSHTILIPNQQLSYALSDKKIAVKNVLTKNVISWKNGFFMFDEVSLLQATKQMSRTYNIPIVILNKNLENFKLSGSISNQQKIEDILMALKSLNNISYEIKNNTVYLK
jgi:ferric-dicitrate binding protein FerR (iron transport regulator)